jgi:gliding motility-associated-like protein
MLNLKIILSFFITLILSFKALALVPPPDVSNDTVIFDLKNALITYNSGERFLDLPIMVSSKNPVSSFDFRMKFNQDKLEYLTTTKVNAQLEPYTYLNTNDYFLRNNTSGPYVSFEIPNKVTLIYVRFKLKNSCESISSTDFSSITTLLMGYPCKSKVTEMVTVSSFQNLLISGLKCTKSILTFSAPTLSAGVPVAKYSWDFGNGNFSNQQTVNISFTNTGNVAIKLNVETVDGCKDSVSQLFDIFDTPVTNFDYTIDQTLDTVFFNNTSTVIEDSMSFEWKFGDMSSSYSINPKHFYATGGDYNVELIARTVNGCFASVEKSIVLAKPNANYTYSSNACVNASITFFDNSTYNQGNITEWYWDFGDQTSSTSKDPSHVFTSSGFYIVKLIVKTSSGIQSQIVKTIEINNKPAVDFIANTTTGCLPLNVSFSSNSTYDSGSRFLYDFGDDEMSTQLDPVHLFNKAQKFTIKKVIITPGGCKDSIVKIGYIDVSPIPLAKFVNTGSCLNTLIDFKDSSLIANGSIVAWNWNFGDGYGLNSKNVSHAYDKVGKYPVKLTITSNLGCVASIQDTIFINKKPTVQFNASKLSGCIPLYPDFNDFSTTIEGSTYQWSFGDNTFSYEKEPNKAYRTDGVYSVKLIVSAPGGCSDSLLIPNYISPLSLVVAKFSESKHCSNSVVNFFDSSYVSSGNVKSWLWDFGNGVTSSQQNASTVFANAGKYNVSLKIVSNQNCENTLVKEIKVDEFPKVSFDVDKREGCFPDVMIFTNSSTFSTGTEFVWDFGDGFSSKIVSPSHKYMDIDTFSVKCTAITPEGCMDSLIKDKFISIQIMPSAKFNIVNKNVFIPKYRLQFENQSLLASAFEWKFGDSTISALKNTTHMFQDSGTFNICLVAKNSDACKSSYCEKVKIVYPGTIAIPNAFSPNNDGQNDDFKVLGGPLKSIDIKIFNSWGSVVFTSETLDQSWDGTKNGESLPIGEYSYVIQCELLDGTKLNRTGVVNLTR